MVAPGRFELPTSGLGNRCSIHLSYGAPFSNLLFHFSLHQSRSTARMRTLHVHCTPTASGPRNLVRQRLSIRAF